MAYWGKKANPLSESFEYKISHHKMNSKVTDASSDQKRAYKTDGIMF
jgi:hypothetical protein